MNRGRSFPLGVVLHTLLVGWSDPDTKKPALDAFHEYVFGKKFSKDEWDQVKHEIRRHLLKSIPILEPTRALCQIQVYTDQVRLHPELLDELSPEFQDDVRRLILEGVKPIPWFALMKQMVGSQIVVTPIKRTTSG